MALTIYCLISRDLPGKYVATTFCRLQDFLSLGPERFMGQGFADLMWL